MGNINSSHTLPSLTTHHCCCGSHPLLKSLLKVGRPLMVVIKLLCTEFGDQGTRINWLRNDLAFVWFLHKNHACISYSPLLLWIAPLIEITAESWWWLWSCSVPNYGPESKNQSIEKWYAICLFSVQKSCLYSLLATVAVDHIPDWNHCWKLVGHWWCGYEAALYQIWGPGNKNQSIEKWYAICLLSVQKSWLHSLLTTVACGSHPWLKSLLKVGRPLMLVMKPLCTKFGDQGPRINWLRNNVPFVCFLYKNHDCIPCSPLLLWIAPLIEITAESW